MKVSDIISEQRTDEVLGTLAGLAAKGGAALLRTPKNIQYAKNMATPITSRAQALRAVKSDLASKGMKPGDFAYEWFKKSKFKDQIKNMDAMRAAGKAEMYGVLTDKGLAFANMLYIADSIYDYYTAKAVLDEKLKLGSISKEEYDKEITLLRGQLIAGYLAPKIAGSLTRLTAGNATNLFSWVVKTAGFPQQAIMMKAAKDIMIKAGQAGLLAYFSTDKGRQWLTDSFGLIVTGLGSVGNLAADFLDYAKAAYQVATGDLPPGFEKKPDSGETNPDMDKWGGDLNQLTGKEIFADPFKGTGRGGR